MNNFTKWWEWMKIFLEILYSVSPNEKEARRAAGLSEKRCKTLEKKTGVRFVKPIRKFWGLKAWPEHFIRFLNEHAKFRGRPPTLQPPPPPPSPPPPRRPEPGTIRW